MLLKYLDIIFYSPSYRSAVYLKVKLYISSHVLTQRSMSTFVRLIIRSHWPDFVAFTAITSRIVYVHIYVCLSVLEFTRRSIQCWMLHWFSFDKLQTKEKNTFYFSKIPVVHFFVLLQSQNELMGFILQFSCSWPKCKFIYTLAFRPSFARGKLWKVI